MNQSHTERAILCKIPDTLHHQVENTDYCIILKQSESESESPHVGPEADAQEGLR